MRTRPDIKFSKIIAVVLICVFALTVFPLHKTNAQLAGLGLSVPTLDIGLNPKEFSLDAITNAIGVALIRTMSDNIQSWVRNGFDGKPLFVTDWENFLQKAGNEAFGIFVDDLIAKGAPDICGPFREDVVLGLVSTSRPRARCTLDLVVANVNSIYNNFETYGWAGFASISTANVANNAFGSFLLNLDRVSLEVAKKTTGLQNEALASRGFLSWKECANYNEDAECDTWRTVTPGSYVANQLDLPQQYSAIKTAVSDEFNELVSVVAQELIRNAVSGSRPGGFYRSQAQPPPDYSSVIESQRAYLSSVLRGDLIAPETQYVEAKQLSANALLHSISVLQELEKAQGVSRSSEITQNRDAFDRIRTEFNLADIKLARFENILRDVGRMTTIAEVNNLAQLVVGIQRDTRSQTEILDAQAQNASLQTSLDALISELQTSGPSRQFLTLSAFPTFITSGRSSILSWSSLNVTSCTALGTGWSGSRPVSNDQKVFPITTSSYRLECPGISGTLTDSTTITVSP